MSTIDSDKSLLDQILAFINEFGCNIEIKHHDTRHIHVVINGCMNDVGQSNKLMQERLCPGLTFETVIANPDRFVFECVERDMTLIINYRTITGKLQPENLDG